MTTIKGRATGDGTARYHARFPGAARRVRHLDGLALSPVGLGTYLGPEDDATDALYRDAVARALACGLNVIDTASSYRAQRSERLIGEVLRAAIASGAVQRDEIVVSTKVGYVPFDGARPPRADLDRYLHDTYFATGLIPPGALVAGVHAMSPRFVDHVIDASRDNLGLDAIDIFYLHNPESGREGLPRVQWLRRIRGAFEVLEGAAGDGRIGCYGVATWNAFRKPPEAPEHHGLAELVELAREVGGDDHHLRVVQLPYNLALIEAAAAPTQPLDGERVTLLEAARRLGLYVFASASVLQGQLASGLDAALRDAIDAASPSAAFTSDAQRSIQFARSTPGIGTALVGTKRIAHVDEVAAVLAVDAMDATAVTRLFADFSD